LNCHNLVGPSIATNQNSLEELSFAFAEKVVEGWSTDVSPLGKYLPNLQKS